MPLAELVAQTDGSRSVARARVLEVRTPNCPPCPPEVTCSACEPPSLKIASLDGAAQTRLAPDCPAQ